MICACAGPPNGGELHDDFRKPPPRHGRRRRASRSPCSTRSPLAQPQFGNPSPTAGSKTSQQANQAADQAAYQPVAYVNASKPGPALVVIPGEIKSNNAYFTIEDHRRTTSPTSPRSSCRAPTSRCWSAPTSGPLLREFELAYNLGDPQQARKFLGMGKLKTTKYVVKFDILKAEKIASAQQGFDGRAIGDMAALAGAFSRSWGGAQAGAVAGRGIGSVQSNEATTVWLVGMRYKIINAETTEQVATGYTEEKMEIGATRQAALGVSQSQQGGVGLDTMVQRLVQKSVWEIDSKYK